MSAICGVALFKDYENASQLGTSIFNKLLIYDYDDTGVIEEDGVYFGCGMIYSTPESKLEQLPRKSHSDRYIITADAIIDNRVELFELLELDKDYCSRMTDSELILHAYEKWGYLCPKYLIGDYAFVIWDKERQELYCARDAMGPRTFYYTYKSNMFAFCTIEKPLLSITGVTAEINEKWLADFLAIDGIQHELDARETVYQDIYQLLPAHYAIIDAKEMKQVQYWDPLKDAKPITYQSDEEYVDAFNRIFFEAVSCRLRSEGEVAIMLSGGMDSGAIACVASKLLEKTDRKLYAYSSIPVNDFEEIPDKRTIYNESTEIDLIKQTYSNIDVSYCSFSGANSFSNIDTVLRTLEQPYKIFQNTTWYLPMLQQASEKKCNIMLNGQVGNGTISYGDFQVHLLTLVRSRKWLSAVKEIHALSRQFNVPVKRVYKLSAKVIMPYKLHEWRALRRKRDFDRYSNVIVKQSLIKKWKLDERLDEIEANVLVTKFKDYDEEKLRRVNPTALSHIGAAETKLSLANRITIRDPSRDRRIVEYCLNIPSNQYVSNGHDRYLLRRAMKGIIPEPIRMNIRTKGLQSADWLHRLKPVWHLVVEEMDAVLTCQYIKPYIDINKLRQLRSEMDHCLDDKNELVVRLTLVAIIVHRFLVDFHSSVNGVLK